MDTWKSKKTFYRFYTDNGIDLAEGIPGLWIADTTPEERQVTTGWVQDALIHKAAWSSRERNEVVLAALEKGERSHV